jgi:bleomycin hydrolase
MLKKISFLSITFCSAISVFAQIASENDPNAPVSPKMVAKQMAAPAGGIFTIIKSNEYTPVKNQGQTGTCWAFSTTSVLETELLQKKHLNVDLSEMYIVRNIYIEKAKNYILRQGNAQFSEGGLGHDLIRATAEYGAIPESAYPGTMEKSSKHDHSRMFPMLKTYVDSVIVALKNLDEKGSFDKQGWMRGYTKILDSYLGKPPLQFKYNGQTYTPQTFAKDFMQFSKEDYINLTSFTHHPFYKPFILEVPDNFSNGSYFNLPIQEMTDVVKYALKNGYTVLWDADVSNPGFNQDAGLALYFGSSVASDGKGKINPDIQESKWESDNRQGLFEDLITQDDHLMHITGIEESPGKKIFFMVKNSWGNNGPFKGFIHVSEAYFGINTISLVVPKAGIPKAILEKLNIK